MLKRYMYQGLAFQYEEGEQPEGAILIEEPTAKKPAAKARKTANKARTTRTKAAE